MNSILKLPIEGSFLVYRNMHRDDRGIFEEIWNEVDLNEALAKEKLPSLSFVQDNISSSKRGVIRGLHMQQENPQGKLITCLRGEIVDVFVDLRPDSPTYLEYCWIDLHPGGKSLYVPPGCAHGFISMDDNTLIHYKCTTKYDADSDGGVRYNDPDLNIPWTHWLRDAKLTISEKDLKLPFLKECGAV